MPAGPPQVATATSPAHAEAQAALLDYDIRRCPLGWVLIARSGAGVCAVFMGDAPEELHGLLTMAFPAVPMQRSPSAVRVYFTDLQLWFSGQRCETCLDWTLDLRGTVFQQQVWQLIRRIPAGQTRSYQQLAIELGQPRAVRAVANACGANRLAIVVPCHRVVRQDRRLSGYRWGLQRKQQLLLQEQTGMPETTRRVNRDNG